MAHEERGGKRMRTISPELQKDIDEATERREKHSRTPGAQPYTGPLIIDLDDGDRIVL